MIPADYLRPIWRCESAPGKGIFVLALDPREARFCLERGWGMLDGVRYRASLNGWSGDLDFEGRIAVRFEIDDPSDALTHAEALLLAHGPRLEAVA